MGLLSNFKSFISSVLVPTIVETGSFTVDTLNGQKTANLSHIFDIHNNLINGGHMILHDAGYPGVNEAIDYIQDELKWKNTSGYITTFPKMIEFIDNGKTGWVCTNFDELENKITDLDLFNNEEIRKVGIKRFSHIRMANDYVKLYKKLMR